MLPDDISEQSPLGEQQGSTQTASDRRAFLRYSHDLQTHWQFLIDDQEEMASARLFDLSATGIGLMTNRAFPVGKTIVIRIPTLTRGWNSHLVRIKRCRELETGEFEIGGMFVKPLSEQELSAHLS
jgi:c-di-GMP-binding flagellar brake protein YcgR